MQLFFSVHLCGLLNNMTASRTLYLLFGMIAIRINQWS